MKYLDVPKLAVLTAYLSGRELGDTILSAKVEAFSCACARRCLRLAWSPKLSMAVLLLRLNGTICLSLAHCNYFRRAARGFPAFTRLFIRNWGWCIGVPLGKPRTPVVIFRFTEFRPVQVKQPVMTNGWGKPWKSSI
jgi:hypothetical protein